MKCGIMIVMREKWIIILPIIIPLICNMWHNNVLMWHGNVPLLPPTYISWLLFGHSSLGWNYINYVILCGISHLPNHHLFLNVVSLKQRSRPFFCTSWSHWFDWTDLILSSFYNCNKRTWHWPNNPWHPERLFCWRKIILMSQVHCQCTC